MDVAILHPFLLTVNPRDNTFDFSRFILDTTLFLLINCLFLRITMRRAMYKHTQASDLGLEQKLILIQNLLALLPRFQALIQQNQHNKDNLDAACELLGISLGEFDQLTQDEKDTVLLQMKRDAWMLFHPDKYAHQADVQHQIGALFHLIDPALAIIKEFLANPHHFTFATTEIAETYLVRPPRDMSLIQFPDLGFSQHRENRANFWTMLIKLGKPILLKKDRSVLVQQYQHLFKNNPMALSNESQTEAILPADLFFELFRQGAIDFVHDSDDMLKVLSCLPAEMVKRIVHSPQFLRCNSPTRFSYFVRYLRLFVPIRVDLDALVYALTHFPEHVRSSVIEHYIAEQYGHGSQPHLVTKMQYQKSCEKLIDDLRKRGLLKVVMGNGLAYLMKNNADLTNAVFNDLEWLLQLREGNALYNEWGTWETAVLDYLKTSGVTDPNQQELLITVMHPNSNELEIFDAKHIHKAYECHQSHLPQWIGLRVQYACRLADRLTQAEQLALSTSQKFVFNEAQLAALNRICEPYRFNYQIRGNQRSVEILQPPLQAWLKDFTQGQYKSIWIETFKEKLNNQWECHLRGEETEYDFITLAKLFKAAGMQNEFSYLRRQFISSLVLRFDQQLLSDDHNLTTNAKTIHDIQKQLQRVNATSRIDSILKRWRMTLRSVCLNLLYPNNRPIPEFQIDEQHIYLIEMGIKPGDIHSYKDFAVVHDNFERRTQQLTDLRSIFNVCHKLGGISEFINLTQRLLPGLAQSLHGEAIHSWATAMP